jgi:hypothetical protein
MVHQLLIFVHVLAVVFVVGYGLFGAILVLAGADEALLERAFGSRWPPPGLPSPVRMPVFALGSLVFLFAVATGLGLVIGGHANASDYSPKLWLVGLAFALQVTLAIRPGRVTLVTHFLVLLAVVAVAAMLSR